MKTMTMKELRINEIMEEQGVAQDVAEQLFLDELEEEYPDVNPNDTDVLEMLYETDAKHEEEMTPYERRIRELRVQEKGYYAAVEKLNKEMRCLYPDIDSNDLDTLKDMYNTYGDLADAFEKKVRRSRVFNEMSGADDLQALCGFKLVQINDLNDDGDLLFRFENDYHVAYEMIIDSEGIYMCQPFAVDTYGNSVD